MQARLEDEQEGYQGPGPVWVVRMLSPASLGRRDGHRYLLPPIFLQGQ